MVRAVSSGIAASTSGHRRAVTLEVRRARAAGGRTWGQLNIDAEEPGHPILVAAERQLAEYFAGRRTEFALALDPSGTDFQRSVWDALRTIPFGETRSYAQIAKQIGKPAAVRAVGAANGRNPLSIVAPCHRVVGSNGALTGFAGGLDVKAHLLTFEGAGFEAPHGTSRTRRPARSSGIDDVARP